MHACYHACMAQLTIRIDDDLAGALKDAARERGQSVNELAKTALRALVDPDAAESGVQRIRERLARAGILADPEPPPTEHVDPVELEAARKRAGRGKSLSEFVNEDRGPR